MKLCSNCKQWKPKAEFYSDKSRADGLEYRCKLCARSMKISKVEQIAMRKREYYLAHRRQIINSETRRRLQQPEKKLAQNRAQYALRTGLIAKAPCEVCGSLHVDAHHDDYSQPLNVRWLCRSHHRQIHSRKDIYGHSTADSAS